jgi:hypothetical protein
MARMFVMKKSGVIKLRKRNARNEKRDVGRWAVLPSAYAQPQCAG